MNEDEIQAAKIGLAEESRRYRRAAAAKEAASKAAIGRALGLLRAGVGPSEVARLSPFTDSYIRKLARENGIPGVTSPRGITAKK